MEQAMQDFGNETNFSAQPAGQNLEVREWVRSATGLQSSETLECRIQGRLGSDMTASVLREGEATPEAAKVEGGSWRQEAGWQCCCNTEEHHHTSM